MPQVLYQLCLLKLGLNHCLWISIVHCLRSARNAFARQAKKDFDNKIITKKQYDTIIERIESAEVDKNVRSMEQGIANKKAKPVTIDKSMGIDEKDMPRKPTRLSKGGMPTGKPRAGHMDYRKKGLFK